MRTIIITRCPECDIESVYLKKSCPKDCLVCGKPLNILDQSIKKPLTEQQRVKQEGRH